MNDSPAPAGAHGASSSQVHVRLPLSKPRWTYGLLAINVIVWLAMTVYGYTQGLGLGGTESTSVLVTFGAQVNSLVAQGQYWRLLSSMFLHVGLVHLLFNSYALYILGRDVESLYGPARFLVLYFLSGLGGSLAFYALGNNVASAGASGAIFGLIGAEAAFFWVHREKFGQRGRQRLLNLVFVIGFNLIWGATVPGINNIAHIGGLITGAAVGWLLAPDYAFPSVIPPGVSPSLEDRNSLQRRLPALAAVVLVLFLLGVAGTSRWSSSTAVTLDEALGLLDSGQAGEAALILRPLAAEEPQDGVVQFYLGVAEAQLGNAEAAQQAWEQSVVLEPDIASTRWNLALVYLDQGRTEDAIAELQAFLERADSGEDRARAERLLDELGR